MSNAQDRLTEAVERADYTYEIAPDEPCNIAIVSAVADQLERDPLQMPELLSTAIDIDVLNDVFEGELTGDAYRPALSFCYCGLDITVYPGRVLLNEDSNAD